MSTHVHTSEDLAGRRVAMTEHDRSILVEAGAGSGKTAVMAGRVAALLASGVPPRAIAAVTFTELAASELLGRVRTFVDDLRAGTIATALQIAFPDGLSDAQKENLNHAADALDEIVCGTIHGFCQRLIKPYPVEAGIDPGAGVMDAAQADLAFEDVLDAWKRDVLGSAEGGPLADLLVHDVKATLALVDRIADTLRKRRDLTVTRAESPALAARAFVVTVEELAREIDASGIDEPETRAVATALANLSVRAMQASQQPEARGAVHIVTMALDDLVFTQDRKFRALQKKSKWGAAAKDVGLPKIEGERRFGPVAQRYIACGDAWARMRACASSHVLGDLVALVRPVLESYSKYKRAAALLDFDDLLFAARDLLRDHDDIRRALAERHQYVLVDEFQDTDPLQTEIFWRLCGEPVGATKDWASFAIRPGALFLVGDPKQAIYRFRGADVGAYVAARTSFQTQESAVVLAISTNFRSCAPVLSHVNDCFAPVLSQANQPGFTPLSAFRPAREGTPSVTALDVRSANEDGKTSADRLRDAEAEAVAQACACLIGAEMIVDKAAEAARPCRPGDIALLAPTGTDLWRYEEALEALGIPVATQAGKGFFRRQEVQDLIAITRVLAALAE
ncbi:MAG: UvrD-helicase domain-containing protein, partial [Caulobacterales bacterium]